MENDRTTLKELFKKYNCDKGHKHKYHEVYDVIFEPYKNSPINFLEIGVFRGESTSAFHEYFQNGTIVGLDIFTRTNPEDLEILKEDRVKWTKFSSIHPGVSNILNIEHGLKYDIILDDGAHDPYSNMMSFRYLNSLLKPGGKYIIEDVWPLTMMTTPEWDHPWVKKHPGAYNIFKENEFQIELENSGYDIIRHDLRDISGEPDSYIIEMTKP